MRRYLFPLLLGIVGCAILISLGVWQLQRMSWKEALLDDIQTQISGAPVALPAQPDATMKYKPVIVSGRTTGQEIDVLSGSKDLGGGYQVISAFETDDGRRILVDRGFIEQDFRHVQRPPTQLRLAGNLHWPQDHSSSTPPPNLQENIWFARDVDAMANALNTLPILVVAADVEGDNQGITPVPVSVEGIPNNHLSYAMQWFMIAMTWAGMTAALIWRIRQRQF